MDKKLKKFFKALEKTKNTGVNFSLNDGIIVSSEKLNDINIPEGYSLDEDKIYDKKNNFIGYITDSVDYDDEMDLGEIDDITSEIIEENDIKNEEDYDDIIDLSELDDIADEITSDSKKEVIDEVDNDEIDLDDIDSLQDEIIEENKEKKGIFTKLREKFGKKDLSKVYEVASKIDTTDEDMDEEVETPKKEKFVTIKKIGETIRNFVYSIPFHVSNFFENFGNKFINFSENLSKEITKNDNDDIDEKVNIENNKDKSIYKQSFNELLTINNTIDDIIDEHDELDFDKFNGRYATLSSALTDLEIRINNNKDIEIKEFKDLKDKYTDLLNDINEYVNKDNIVESKDINTYASKLDEISKVIFDIETLKRENTGLDNYDNDIIKLKNDYQELFNKVADNNKEIELTDFDSLKNNAIVLKDSLKSSIKPEVSNSTKDFKFTSIDDTKAKFEEYDKPEIELKEISEKIAYYEEFLNTHDLSHADDQGMKQRMEEKLAVLKEKYNEIMESKKDKNTENDLRTEKMAFYTQTTKGIEEAIENNEIERQIRLLRFKQDKTAISLDAEETRSFSARKEELEALKAECLKRKAEVNKYYVDEEQKLINTYKTL